MNETIDLMLRHRSVREYEATPVSDEHIHTAIRAGQKASSSSNVQAYCLIRITDRRKREALIDLSGGQPKVARCGAFFVVCGDTRRHRLACESHGREYEAGLEAFLLAVIDATLFAQNLSLAFESLGYGMCYIGGLRNHLPETSRLLNIPLGIYPLYGLCVGIPAEQPHDRPRLPLAAVYFEDAYPEDEAMNALMAGYDPVIDRYQRHRGSDRPPWTRRMAEMFSSPRRPGLGDYYRSQGANLT